MSERPNIVNIDNQGRLHCEDGPALSYLDGWSIYAVHGIRVPAWIIEYPDQITPKKIAEENNAEIRRVMMQKYGWERMLSQVKAKMIDKHPDPTIGELWRWREPDGIDVQILRTQNGTPDPLTGQEKWYSIRVPLNINRAIDANRNSYPIARHLSDDEFLTWNSSRA